MTRRWVAFDTETTGLNTWGTAEERGFWPARPFAVSWCWDNGKTGYARFEVDPFTREVLYDRKPKAFKRVAKFLSNPNVDKVGFNTNFDRLMCEAAGWTIRGRIYDAKTLVHTATMGGEMVYALKPLCDKFFEFSDQDQKDLRESVLAARHIAKLKGWRIACREDGHRKVPWAADYWLGDHELCKRYAIQDAERTALLYMFFLPMVLANEGMKRVWERETKLSTGAVWQMENAGVRIFPKHIKRLERYYDKYLAKQRRIITSIAGEDFNPNSPLQKIQKCITEQGLAPLRMTKPSKKFPKGQPSVDGVFMQHYAPQNKLCDAIVEWTNTYKAIHTFLEQYQRFWWEESPGIKILNPHIRTTGTITGRMSCSDPNLMNVASETTGRRRSRIAMKPREAMGPRPGKLWYLPDYSQIEVWLFAHLSGNTVMMKALLTGQDFHGYVARIVWGHLPDFEPKFTYYRKCAKLIMFCTLYGGGVKKLATLIPCSVSDAEKFKEAHSRNVPGIREFIQRTSNMVIRQGFLTNPMGRHYKIDPDFSYRAVNYLIQGSAADVLKSALNLVYDLLQEEWPEAQILLSMHDEIMIEIPYKYHCKRLMRQIVTCMQKAGEPMKLPVLLPVGIKICRRRWFRVKEIPLGKPA